jgi:hypothetical protein
LPRQIVLVLNGVDVDVTRTIEDNGMLQLVKASHHFPNRAVAEDEVGIDSCWSAYARTAHYLTILGAPVDLATVVVQMLERLVVRDRALARVSGGDTHIGRPDINGKEARIKRWRREGFDKLDFRHLISF